MSMSDPRENGYTGDIEDPPCNDGGGYSINGGLCPCCFHEVLPVEIWTDGNISSVMDCCSCGWCSDVYYE